MLFCDVTLLAVNGLCMLDAFQTLSVAHVVSPCITMFVLALVHSQIMAIYETSQYSQFKAKTKTKRYVY